MDEQNRSDHATNVTAAGDILERLHDILDGPVPMYVTRQDIRDTKHVAVNSSGGDAQHRWTVTVIVGRSADRAAQRSLFEYISYSGTKSVRAAIEADRTLGGVCQTLLVERADNIRMLTQGDANYLAADFAVRIHA